MSLKGIAFIALPAAIVSGVCVSCTRPSPQFAPASLTASEKSCYDAINTAHTQEEAAVSRKDINGMMTECSPDYVGTTPDGRTADYAQTRQSISQLIETTSEMKETNSITDLRLTGDTAVVRVQNHVEATFPVINPLTGKPITRVQDHVDRETWVKGQGGWLLTRSDVLSAS